MSTEMVERMWRHMLMISSAILATCSCWRKWWKEKVVCRETKTRLHGGNTTRRAWICDPHSIYYPKVFLCESTELPGMCLLQINLFLLMILSVIITKAKTRHDFWLWILIARLLNLARISVCYAAHKQRNINKAYSGSFAYFYRPLCTCIFCLSNVYLSDFTGEQHQHVRMTSVS